jgi:23S rRNA pseudouridine1911/1915/1917 synthase
MTAERTELTHRVTAGEAGSRFDKVVSSIAAISRAASADLVSSGHATLNSRPAKGNTRVSVDDIVTVLTLVDDELLPVPMPIDIAYADDDVLVINKAPGRVVHPGAGHQDDTLINGLLYQYPELGELGDDRRWGLVHRLDKDTSGLLMVGRTSQAFDGLRSQLAAREIERVYTALVHGSVPGASGTVDAPIARDPSQPTRMALVRGGRSARTHFRAIERWGDHDLLRVILETGRTHQIRVHLQSIGHPIVGDPVYGDRLTSIADPGRVWLHATNLRFQHPVSNEEIRVSAPLPRDLAESLDVLRAS